MRQRFETVGEDWWEEWKRGWGFAMLVLDDRFLEKMRWKIIILFVVR